nr:homeodomain-like protein [Tanacetum cinerariifolium]
MSKVLQERGFGSLPRSTDTNPRDHVKSISTTVEADMTPIRPNSYEASHIDNSIPRKEKDLGSFTLPCYINYVYFDNALADLGASERGFGSLPSSTETNPRDHVKSISTIVEADANSIHRMGSSQYAISTGQNSTLMRNQVDNLIPTVEEGEVINAPMDDLVKPRNDELNTRIDDYPSCRDYDKKIRINCAHNLKFSCMIGFEFIHVNFFPLLYVNVMSKKFHNSIMKDKLVYKWNNVVGALINVPIFVGTFSVVTDFAVLEDMDAYRDEGMGNVIVSKPFLKEIRIKARRFDGMITIYNGNDEVTYQMVQSHLRFKHQTYVQCNKIPSLMKVSEEDKKNEILHPYKKLNGFY